MNTKAEFQYLGIIIIALTISLIQILITGRIGGEFQVFELDITIVELVSIYSINILTLLLLYKLYSIYIKRKMRIKYKLRFKIRLLSQIVLVFLSFQIVFTYVTGVGVVGSQGESALGFIFVLISPVPLFYVYFFMERGKPTSIFYANIALFSTLQILQGWSGFIMFLFFCELYHRYHNEPKGLLILCSRSYVFFPMFFLLGALMYMIIYPIKNEVRGEGYKELNYQEAVFVFASRLSFLAPSVSAYQNSMEIKRLHELTAEKNREVRSLLRPLLPSAIVGQKDFRSFNNILIWSYYEGVNKYTGAGMGLPIFLYMLYIADDAEFLAYVISFLILLLLMVIFFSILEQFPGQLNFVLYLFLIKLYVGGSLEIGFSYGFLNCVYFLSILFILKICFFRRVAV